MMRFMVKAVAGAVCAALSCAALAQNFPVKPVRIVVPFPPGGGVDIVARVVGPKLAAQYGQQVIIENRAGAPHRGGELFNRLAGVKITHVSYKGSGPSFADLLGGHVSLTYDSMLQSLPYIRDKKLVALGVLGGKRAAALPDVPTIAEQGVKGYELTNWFGLVVSAATPKDLIARIHGDFTKVLQEKDIRDRIAAWAPT